MTERTSTRPLQLAVLISGGGTTLLNLIRKIQLRAVGGRNSPGHFQSSARRRTAARGPGQIPCQIVSRRDFTTTEAFSAAIFQPVERPASTWSPWADS